MFLSQRINKLPGLIFCFAASCANAEIVQDVASSTVFNNFEISAAGGINWYRVPDTYLVISSVETDSNKVEQYPSGAIWKIGAGYYFFEDILQDFPFLNHLLLEVNVYHTSATIEGDTWQFKMPKFNNYSFDAPVTSTRLMLDVKPTLFIWKNISPYAIFGVGATWNQISYHETAIAADINPATALKLSDNTTSRIAWDLGIGMSVALTDNLNVTAEYIYAFLGEGSPAHHPTNGISLKEPPAFSLETQSLLLGLCLHI